MKVQKSRGTRDTLPADMRKFRYIEAAFHETCLKWSYSEVRTPTIEYLHLFTSTGTLTPGKLGKVYSFLDWDGWSGERVVLKPDGTIPVARLFIEEMQGRIPARLYYVTNIFAFEETGKENRERWQCGAELIGIVSPAAEAELAILAIETLNKMGLRNINLRLSHADLIRALIAKLGADIEERHRLFDRLMDGDETLLSEMKKASPDIADALSAIMLSKGKSAAFLKNLQAIAKNGSYEMEAALKDFISFADLLEGIGVNYEIDLTSGRGFEYYTGVMFKLLANGEEVGGGGRYDDLIPQMGGGEMPACGVALYFDKLIQLVSVGASGGGQMKRVIVQSKSATSLGNSLKLIQELHQAGYPAELITGEEQPSDAEWQISVQDTSPVFQVTECSSGKKTGAGSMAETIALLH